MKNNKKLSLYSNYNHSKFDMDGDICLVGDKKLSIEETILHFRSLVEPYELIRCEILNGVFDQSLNKGKGGFIYNSISSNVFDLSKKVKNSKIVSEKMLKTMGYSGNFELSNIIDWIRTKFQFNIFVEHGVKGTFDVTTNLCCHRGSYGKYEDAQLKGIEIFVNAQ